MDTFDNAAEYILLVESRISANHLIIRKCRLNQLSEYAFKVVRERHYYKRNRHCVRPNSHSPSFYTPANSSLKLTVRLAFPPAEPAAASRICAASRHLHRHYRIRRKRRAARRRPPFGGPQFNVRTLARH